MIVLTTGIHATFMVIGLRLMKKWGAAYPDYGLTMATVAISTFVLVMFGAAILEIWSWTALFLYAGFFDALEPAVYFTTVTYTTLGYGDITLGAGHRQLAAVCAANGLIMFGWTTALVFAVVQRVYFAEGSSRV